MTLQILGFPLFSPGSVHSFEVGQVISHGGAGIPGSNALQLKMLRRNMPVPAADRASLPVPGLFCPLLTEKEAQNLSSAPDAAAPQQRASTLESYIEISVLIPYR